MKTATYTNKYTNEVYTLAGVKNIAHAWKLLNFVGQRTGWSNAPLADDFVIRVK